MENALSLSRDIILTASTLMLLKEYFLGTKMNIYDYLFFYETITFTFAEEFTPLIDLILLDTNHGEIGKFKIESNNVKIPDIGTHYFYLQKENKRPTYPWNVYITLEKKKDNDGKIFYEGYCSSFSCGEDTCNDALKLLQKKLIYDTEKEINAISIVTSSNKPFLSMLRISFKEPYENQIKGTNLILQEWNDKNNYNVKCIITGESGIGKTVLAKQIKRFFDKKYPTKIAKLYINFNPSLPGMDITDLILKHASAQSPVIIILDEIDIYFDLVSTPTIDYYDSRIMNTKDKSTWNAMMDIIGDTPNVFFIGTTQKSKKELYDGLSDLNKSMIRKGRIDFFLEMTKDDCVKIDNYNKF